MFVCVCLFVVCACVCRAARSKQNNCSALTVSLTGEDVVVAKASFAGKLRGAIYFVSTNITGFLCIGIN